MSFAEYNPNAYYEVGNIVSEGAVNYNCIQANSPLSPQLPSASPLYWTAVPTGGGLSAITSGVGSGITTNNAGGIGLISTNLIADAPITLTPSTIDNSIVIGSSASSAYGSFYSSNTQPLTVDEPYFFTYDTVVVANGVELPNTTPSSGIQVATGGDYKISFNIQWNRTVADKVADVQAYIRTSNKGDIAWSSRTMTIPNTDNYLMSGEAVVNLVDGETIQIVGYVPNIGDNTRAVAIPAGGGYALSIPSITTTVEKL